MRNKFWLFLSFKQCLWRGQTLKHCVYNKSQMFDQRYLRPEPKFQFLCNDFEMAKATRFRNLSWFSVAQFALRMLMISLFYIHRWAISNAASTWSSPTSFSTTFSTSFSTTVNSNHKRLFQPSDCASHCLNNTTTINDPCRFVITPGA